MADLAAFDFDGTLTHGGSVIGFLSALVGRRTVQAATLALAPRLAAAALVGGGAADEAERNSDAGWPAVERATLASPWHPEREPVSP